ncbi:MAG: hypothetical protein JJ892_06780 [Balneola sp.]|nr:hypothetical protein [Balneola sp.]MBO6651941.1 hypothetical protein [Balneola sp.]MBO6711776.1 hypothetical protein [Balneola sp.]MBO6799970.1 hypothetical protein [Balneola sp.]MBO6871215.1 hypothetical protein [Balneola sp.]
MIKSIASLFTSSLLGRIIGFFRFQLLVFIFSQTHFTDKVIYTTTLIWTLNNFFVIPNVNKSLIADLSGTIKENYSSILWDTSMLAFRSGVFAGLISVLIILFLQLSGSPLDFKVYDLVLVFIIVIGLGQNEVFSLYNQFKKRFFLYALNPGVWNTVLIIGILTMWFLGSTELYIYLIFLLIAILSTIYMQYSKVDVPFSRQSVINTMDTSIVKSPKKDYWYNGVVILFMGTTFLDLNFITIFSVAGIVTVYTILLKIPELMLSIINGSVQPVFFNLIMDKQDYLKKSFNRFLILSSTAFILMGLFLFAFKYKLYQYLFNFQVAGYESSLLLVIIMAFFASFSYMIVRLSEEFKYSKKLFFGALAMIIIKLFVIITLDFSLDMIIYTNIATYVCITIIGLYFLFLRKSTHFLNISD